MKDQTIVEMQNDTVVQVQVQADHHPVQVTDADLQKREMIHEEVIRNPVTTETIPQILGGNVHPREIVEIVIEEADPIRDQIDGHLQTEIGKGEEIVAEARTSIITDLQ